MTTFSDFNPAGTTRTSKTGRARHIPLLPDHFNHLWIQDYLDDFIDKNVLENNGVISGCVISQDGGNDAINTTGGEVYINGNKVAVTAPSTFNLTADGWYVSYVTAAGAVIHGFLDNSTAQGAVTPNDTVIIGYTVLGNSVFYINSFFKEIEEFVGIDDSTKHIQPVVTVGPALTDSRVTDLETTFVASLTDGDKLLFLDSTILTANRTLTTEVEVWMDGPDEKLDLDTFDLTFLEVSGKITITTSTGKLILNGRTHNLIIIGAVVVEHGTGFSGSYVLNGVAYSNGVYSDFTTKNLIINVQSNTTVDLDADNIVFVDEFGGGKRVDNINETFDITTDRQDGTGTTNELASTWYQKWLDISGNKALLPDIEGSADGTSSGFLVDSGNKFFTHLVKAGDIIYNLTDLSQTTVAVTPTADNANLDLVDDIFTSGEDYKIRMLSPVGLGPIRARLGAAFNNGSSNFDDSTYTQIQEEKTYSEDAGDFSTSGASWTVKVGSTFIVVRQVNDWTGKGTWKLVLAITGVVAASASSLDVTISDILFPAGSNNRRALSGWVFTSGSILTNFCTTTENTAVIQINLDSAFSNPSTISYAGEVETAKKPLFHN